MLLTSSIKREVMHFHVVVVHRRQRNIQKSVLQVQSCCCFFYVLIVHQAPYTARARWP